MLRARPVKLGSFAARPSTEGASFQRVRQAHKWTAGPGHAANAGKCIGAVVNSAQWQNRPRNPKCHNTTARKTVPDEDGPQLTAVDGCRRLSAAVGGFRGLSTIADGCRRLLDGRLLNRRMDPRFDFSMFLLDYCTDGCWLAAHPGGSNRRSPTVPDGSRRLPTDPDGSQTGGRQASTTRSS